MCEGHRLMSNSPTISQRSPNQMLPMVSLKRSQLLARHLRQFQLMPMKLLYSEATPTKLWFALNR